MTELYGNKTLVDLVFCNVLLNKMIKMKKQISNLVELSILHLCNNTIVV